MQNRLDLKLHSGVKREIISIPFSIKECFNINFSTKLQSTNLSDNNNGDFNGNINIGIEGFPKPKNVVLNPIIALVQVSIAFNKTVYSIIENIDPLILSNQMDNFSLAELDVITTDDIYSIN